MLTQRNEQAATGHGRGWGTGHGRERGTKGDDPFVGHSRSRRRTVQQFALLTTFRQLGEKLDDLSAKTRVVGRVARSRNGNAERPCKTTRISAGQRRLLISEGFPERKQTARGARRHPISRLFARKPSISRDIGWQESIRPDSTPTRFSRINRKGAGLRRDRDRGEDG